MNRHSRNSRFLSTALAVALMGCFVEAAGTETSENPTGVGAKRQPVNYLVKEKSLIGNEMFEAGSIAAYDGLPAGNLEPTCDIGRARAAEYEASNKSRVALMIENHKESGVGDPTKFMESFTKMMAEERAEHQAQVAAQQETMARMVEMQQNASLQLAEAANNMAKLAALITAPPAVAEVAEAPAAAASAAASETASGDAATKTTKAAKS